MNPVYFGVPVCTEKGENVFVVLAWVYIYTRL